MGPLVLVWAIEQRLVHQFWVLYLGPGCVVIRRGFIERALLTLSMKPDEAQYVGDHRGSSDQEDSCVLEACCSEQNDGGASEDASKASARAKEAYGVARELLEEAQES